MSIKKLTFTVLTALTLSATSAVSSGDEVHIHDTDFSFESPFGTYDQAQLRRGLQVYTEVCSSCHGLRYVPLRTLGDDGGPSLPDAEVREYAKQFEAADTSDGAELGDTREAKPSDFYPVSADPTAPDLSLMAKSRAGYHGPYGLGLSQLINGMGGPEYILSILVGYEDAPACAPKEFGGYYNTSFAPGGYPDECKIFEETKIETVQDDGTVVIKIERKEIGRKAPGSWIAMPPPLYGEDVDFADGHSNELHHEAEDTAAFLMWAAEPKMMDRKRAGFIGVLMLTMLSVLLYATNKRIWAPVKRRAKEETENS